MCQRNYGKQLGFGSPSELSGLSEHEYRHLPAHDARVARHARCWANKLLKNGILSRSLHAAVASFPKDSTPRNYDKQLGFGSSSEPRALSEHEYRHPPAHGARVARHASEPTMTVSAAKRRAAPCPSTTSRSSAPRPSPAPAACRATWPRWPLAPRPPGRART